MQRKLIDKKGLREIGVPYSWTHIQRLEDAELFPKRVKLGACRIAWVYDEIVEWIDARVAQRDTTLPS